MYRLGRRLLRSRSAMLLLLLTLWSVAFATPCLPESMAAGSDVAAAAHAHTELDGCGQHSRDYQTSTLKQLDDGRTLKLLALPSTAIAPLRHPTVLSGALGAADRQPILTLGPLYLATARLRI
jgi:hypothetical protein